MRILIRKRYFKIKNHFNCIVVGKFTKHTFRDMLPSATADWETASIHSNASSSSSDSSFTSRHSVKSLLLLPSASQHLRRHCWQDWHQATVKDMKTFDALERQVQEQLESELFALKMSTGDEEEEDGDEEDELSFGDRKSRLGEEAVEDLQQVEYSKLLESSFLLHDQDTDSQHLSFQHRATAEDLESTESVLSAENNYSQFSDHDEQHALNRDPGGFNAAATSMLLSSAAHLHSAETTDHQIQQKVQELKTEIERFKKMNGELKMAKQHYETARKQWQSDKNSVQKEAEKELDQMRLQFEQEVRKWRKEKRIWEKHHMTTQSIPNKKERTEIEELKKRIEELEMTHRSRETKAALNVERLKKRIEELTARNHELKEQVRVLEADLLPPIQQSSHRLGDGETAMDKENNLFQATNKAKSTSTVHFKRKNIAVPSKMDDVVARIAQKGPLGSTDPPTTVPPAASSKYRQSVSSQSEAIHPQNTPVSVRLPNGDIKTTYPDGTWVYEFTETKIVQRHHVDGTIVYQFPNGQSEKRFPDGTSEITYADRTTRFIYPNKEEEVIFSDGTISRTDAEGKRVIEYLDGTREVHWKHMKQRFERDGSVRTVYADGTREMRYPDGRCVQLSRSQSSSSLVSSNRPV